ncbi:uncharacterized protein L203_106435 [Cryptococcus depauperatus CBS 7841]|uniref:Kinase n=1 Tax=Cryptococcus depauperatus CBS 7841 TaxID=1295531 RepID=A0AAJ8JZI9_9TREE
MLREIQHISIGSSIPLTNQVAGHEGVLSDASGSLPALPREVAFYQTLSVAEPLSPAYALKRFVPRSYGTLRLEGQLDSSGGVDTSVKDAVPESVVLENLAYAYTRPNVMDAKLGTVLYGPDATPEKRAKMDQKARETTSHETGLRFAGCQLHLHAQLLCPPPTASTDSASVAQRLPIIAKASADSGAQMAMLPPTPITPEMQTNVYTSHSIPSTTLLRLLNLLLSEIDTLYAVMEKLEMRFVGASLLIVYEGDADRLKDALERHERKQAQTADGQNDPTKQRSAFSNDGSDVSSETDSDEDFDEDDILDETKENASRAQKCPLLTVKLIDFAHTHLAEGEGPDEGMLKGMRTLRHLIEGRKREVEASLSNSN